MRTIGGHHPCLIIADGNVPEAEAVVFKAHLPKHARLAVQDVGDDEIVPGADMLLLREGEITNRPLIERSALSGVPVLLCTRGSSLKEISRAVGWHQLAFRSGTERAHTKARVGVEGGGRLILLHGGANLRALARISEQTLVPVGWQGDENGSLAVAAGACVLLSSAAGFVKATTRVRAAEEALGEARAETSPEAPGKRRTVVAARDLEEGHVVKEDDLMSQAPLLADAFEPYQLEDILGRCLNAGISKGEPIRREMLEGKAPEPPPWFSPRPPRSKPT